MQDIVIQRDINPELFCLYINGELAYEHLDEAELLEVIKDLNE